jgi:uncharacterized protein (DUF488 family)
VSTLWTIGHGTLAADELISLLAAEPIEVLVDVRSFPGSRHNLQFGRPEMERWVPQARVEYRWMSALGGRRRAVEGSKHLALRNTSFQAYADHMETPTFLAGVDELLSIADDRPTVVMCSEAVWWRCHRRLLADHLVLVRGAEVGHLMHDGRRTDHPLTEGARLVGDTVVYDAGR